MVQSLASLVDSLSVDGLEALREPSWALLWRIPTASRVPERKARRVFRVTRAFRSLEIHQLLRPGPGDGTVIARLTEPVRIMTVPPLVRLRPT